MLPGPAGRLPRRLEAAGLPVEADLVVRAGLNHTAARPRRSTCSAAPTGRPRSSPATTCRRSASTRPPGGRAAIPRRPQRRRLRRPADRPLVEPPLTTVHQPLTEMAVVATELALALAGGRAPQVRLEMATTLAVRDSTAPPKRPERTAPGGGHAGPGRCPVRRAAVRAGPHCPCGTAVSGGRLSVRGPPCPAGVDSQAGAGALVDRAALRSLGDRIGGTDVEPDGLGPARRDGRPGEGDRLPVLSPEGRPRSPRRPSCPGAG